jgi:hypothetical protein
MILGILFFYLFSQKRLVNDIKIKNFKNSVIGGNDDRNISEISENISELTIFKIFYEKNNLLKTLETSSISKNQKIKFIYASDLYMNPYTVYKGCLTKGLDLEFI